MANKLNEQRDKKLDWDKISQNDEKQMDGEIFRKQNKQKWGINEMWWMKRMGSGWLPSLCLV